MSLTPAEAALQHQLGATDSPEEPSRQPVPVVDDYDELDRMLMGAPEAVKFPEVGTTISGRIHRVYAVQQTDFETREPQWWDDGSPKMQVVAEIELQEGLRSLYISSKGLREAIREACRAAGSGLREGGYLVVKYEKDGELFRKGINPPKIYQAGYDAPGRKPIMGRGEPRSLETAALSQPADAEPPW
jgi:hypothetical protein